MFYWQETKEPENAKQPEDETTGTSNLPDISDITEGDWSDLMPFIEKYLIPALAALLVLFVAYFVAKFLARVASTPIRRRVDETLGRFVGRLVFYSIMIFALLGVLGMFGVSVASFAAVLASVGFAIGLAFQGSLSNFAAGILLLVLRPFKVGDVVSAGGVTGKVDQLDLFSTTFDTPDNRRIIVPNGAISSGNIENVSYHPERRVDVAVGVDYSAALDATRNALTKAAESLEEYLLAGEGRGFQIVLGNLGDSAVEWTVRFWTKADNYWIVKEQLTAAVKTSLDIVGIGIPFPQMDVHLVKND